MQFCWLSFCSIVWDLITVLVSIVRLFWETEKTYSMERLCSEKWKEIYWETVFFVIPWITFSILKSSLKNKVEKSYPQKAFPCSCQIRVSARWHMYLQTVFCLLPVPASRQCRQFHVIFYIFIEINISNILNENLMFVLVNILLL